MQIMSRESRVRWNGLRFREVRMEYWRRHVMSIAAVYMEQRSIHKAYKHSCNGVTGCDFPHGGTIPHTGENVQSPSLFGCLSNWRQKLKRIANSIFRGALARLGRPKKVEVITPL